MKTVFLVQHLHDIPDKNEDIKIIGIYSSKQTALEAIERTKILPGFSEYPRLIDPIQDDEESGFYIGEYALDKDHWDTGYVTE
jgi:homoserine kinase type II